MSKLANGAFGLQEKEISGWKHPPLILRTPEAGKGPSFFAFHLLLFKKQGLLAASPAHKTFKKGRKKKEMGFGIAKLFSRRS